MKGPLVYVILLTYNGKKNLEYCLPSILKTKYSNFKILLIDNASSDGSSDYVKINFPKISVVTLNKNKGYAGGNNVGIKYAIRKGAKYIILQNDDTLVDPRWLAEGVKVMESDPVIGMLDYDIVGKFKAGSLKVFRKKQKALKKIKVKNTNLIRGCCLLVRSELFQNIGMFDETFFAYGEESDLNYRVLQAGYKLKIINVPVLHYYEGTFSKMRLRASYLTMRNTMRQAIKNYNLFLMIKTILFVLNVSLNPFKKVYNNRFLMRLRPRNPLFNLLLLTPAILWNIIFLPHTLFLRIVDDVKIRNTRRKLKGL